MGGADIFHNKRQQRNHLIEHRGVTKPAELIDLPHVPAAMDLDELDDDDLYDEDADSRDSIDASAIEYSLLRTNKAGGLADERTWLSISSSVADLVIAKMELNRLSAELQKAKDAHAAYSSVTFLSMEMDLTSIITDLEQATSAAKQKVAQISLLMAKQFRQASGDMDVTSVRQQKQLRDDTRNYISTSLKGFASDRETFKKENASLKQDVQRLKTKESLMDEKLQKLEKRMSDLFGPVSGSRTIHVGAGTTYANSGWQTTNNSNSGGQTTYGAISPRQDKTPQHAAQSDDHNVNAEQPQQEDHAPQNECSEIPVASSSAKLNQSENQSPRQHHRPREEELARDRPREPDLPRESQSSRNGQAFDPWRDAPAAVITSNASSFWGAPQASTERPTIAANASWGWAEDQPAAKASSSTINTTTSAWRESHSAAKSSPRAIVTSTSAWGEAHAKPPTINTSTWAWGEPVAKSLPSRQHDSVALPSSLPRKPSPEQMNIVPRSPPDGEFARSLSSSTSAGNKGQYSRQSNKGFPSGPEASTSMQPRSTLPSKDPRLDSGVTKPPTPDHTLTQSTSDRPSENPVGQAEDVEMNVDDALKPKIHRVRSSTDKEKRKHIHFDAVKDVSQADARAIFDQGKNYTQMKTLEASDWLKNWAKAYVADKISESEKKILAMIEPRSNGPESKAPVGSKRKRLSNDEIEDGQLHETSGDLSGLEREDNIVAVELVHRFKVEVDLQVDKLRTEFETLQLKVEAKNYEQKLQELYINLAQLQNVMSTAASLISYMQPNLNLLVKTLAAEENAETAKQISDANSRITALSGDVVIVRNLFDTEVKPILEEVHNHLSYPNAE